MTPSLSGLSSAPSWPISAERPGASEFRAWAMAAEARLGAVLASLETALEEGQEPTAAGQIAVDAFLAGLRPSLLVLPSREVGAWLRQTEAAHWARRAERAVSEADADPESVVRLLVTWLAVIQQAAAQGYGRLHLAP